jgi:hypothetical protein
MRRYNVIRTYCKEEPIKNIEPILNKDEQINDMYKKFIEEKCIYEPLYITSFNDINKTFNEFFKNHSIGRFRSDKLLNIDNRFSLKSLRTCKYCDKKHNKFCCDEYKVKNSNEKLFIINLKLKDSLINT